MKNAIDFIEDNLTEHIDIDEIARRTYSSLFHFQRMFHMLTGVTVSGYIRRRRLTLAAQDLALATNKVLDVALKYGYESPESFAKAFRKVHGLSPSDARAEGVQLKTFPRISFHLSLTGGKEIDYRIVKREAFPVTGKMIRVSYQDGENLRRVPQFWQECYTDGTVDKLRELHPERTLYGVCLCTNHQTEELTYAIAVEGDIKPDDGEWTTADIPASTWAVFRSTGSLPNAIQDLWRRIFEEWFPATSYQHAGGPEIELLPPGDDLAPDYQSEVWVPVVKNE